MKAAINSIPQAIFRKLPTFARALMYMLSKGESEKNDMWLSVGFDSEYMAFFVMMGNEPIV